MAGIPRSTAIGRHRSRSRRKFVGKVVVQTSNNVVELKPASTDEGDDSHQVMNIPFCPFRLRRKGVTHEPEPNQNLSPESRQTLLQAIARSRAWMQTIVAVSATSLAEIAAVESLDERRIGFLLPLAFLSPRVISTIAACTAPADLTVTSLARALCPSLAVQERLILQIN